MMGNEYERLLAVNRFKDITPGISQDLDNLVTLISQICETPVALVTIIDENMQWFQAKTGTEINCNERELSFCQYTIRQDNMLIIPDTQKDERFNQLPLVIHEPHVRFYAGVTLITYDGYAVGTVCVIDIVPRELTEMQISALRTLAKQVLNIMELNWSVRSLSGQYTQMQKQKMELEGYAMKLNAVFNSAKELHVLLSPDLEVLAFNKAAAVHIQTYYSLQLETGKPILDFISPSSSKRLQAYASQAISGTTQYAEWRFNIDGELRWMDVTFSAVRDEAGKIIGVSINAADTTIAKRHAERVDHQNKALQRIAAFQSHEIRRPVASLLGIFDLVKDEPALSDNTYVSMMSSAVKDLDLKIRGIVKDAENTIYSSGLMSYHFKADHAL